MYAIRSYYVLFTAWASGQQDAGQGAVNLKFNFVKSSSDPEYKWYDAYFKEISEKSGGTITYDLYPSEARNNFV